MMRTPILWSFVGIYFNQDWPEDYETERASIDAFISEDPDSVAGLLEDIQRTRDQFTTEEELAAYMETQGGEYIPPSDEGGYRGWLTRITDHVRAATQR